MFCFMYETSEQAIEWARRLVHAMPFGGIWIVCRRRSFCIWMGVNVWFRNAFNISFVRGCSVCLIALYIVLAHVIIRVLLLIYFSIDSFSLCFFIYVTAFHAIACLSALVFFLYFFFYSVHFITFFPTKMKIGKIQRWVYVSLYCFGGIFFCFISVHSLLSFGLKQEIYTREIFIATDFSSFYSIKLQCKRSFWMWMIVVCMESFANFQMNDNGFKDGFQNQNVYVQMSCDWCH